MKSRLRLFACFVSVSAVALTQSPAVGFYEDQMVTAFGRGDYKLARELAGRIRDSPEAKDRKYSQYQAVLDDRPPEKFWSLVIGNENLPEGSLDWDESDWHRYRISQQKGRLPDGFEKMPEKLKIEFLIERLSGSWAHQNGFPGGVDLTEDIFVWKLIEIGDPAVSRLIDVIKHDKRLTRASHFWRGGNGGTILSVKDAALTAVMSILQIQIFDPPSTGSNLTNQPEETAIGIVTTLRDYWREFGQIEFDQRMMAMLMDPGVSELMRREAATNLAALGGKRTFSTTVDTTRISLPPAERANPAIARFSSPTAAEAILNALDRALDAFEPSDPQNLDLTEQMNASDKNLSVDEFRWEEVFSSYFGPLKDIGDARICDQLVARFRLTKPSALRLWYADSCANLGNLKPVKSLAAEIEAGDLAEWKIPPAHLSVLNQTLTIVARHQSPATARAIRATIARSHPLHESVRDLVFECSEYLNDPFRDSPLHLAATTPAGLDFLQSYLDDRSLIGKEEGRLLAGRVLAETVFGYPPPEEAGTDLDTSIGNGKRWIGRMRESVGLRRISPLEAEHLIDWYLDTQKLAYLIPDIEVLEQAAILDDVLSDRAAFALEGKRTAVTEGLPAFAREKKTGQSVYLFQCERDSAGQVFYGVIHSAGGLRKLRDTEIEWIHPIAPIRARP